ncbi:hypothetical protein GE061_002077 [Apolygus lucorum]|uniref:Mothers against decapentaplegic homolog n=1 Tax=Apolygus lucorum TaxID=248454 RepID=A0A8S9X459_APOLU|nr:hypothetical protein GE061_002077 [Apolygus lucorum]
MLMFRRRRNGFTKRLLKARLGNEGTSREVIHRKLFKRLDEVHLDMLLTAVEEKDGSPGCILLEDVTCVLDGPAHLITCQLYRWSDLESERELKRLPSCKSGTGGSVCCNPYHWSRMCSPESPPPPYSRFACDRLKPEDRAPSESSQLELRGSLSTNGDEENRCTNHWCKLAYWELAQRVGPQYPVEEETVNVFWDLLQGDGLCLATLAQKQADSTNDVKRARDKIGKGVTLSREDDGVWAYNRSECPMFVNSPALEDPDSRSYLMVYRVPPGHCLNIYSEAARRRTPTVSRPHFGPVDPNSVRISFAKGWGPKYSRQEVTSCPTWLEILLSPISNKYFYNVRHGKKYENQVYELLEMRILSGSRGTKQHQKHRHLCESRRTEIVSIVFSLRSSYNDHRIDHHHVTIL